MSELKKLDEMDLEKVTGGNDGAVYYNWVSVKASVQTGYLALRSWPEYNDDNILERINNGVGFLACYDQQDGEYILGCYNSTQGWVNRNYVVKT